MKAYAVKLEAIAEDPHLPRTESGAMDTSQIEFSVTVLADSVSGALEKALKSTSIDNIVSANINREVEK